MDNPRKVEELKTSSGEGIHPQGCDTSPVRGEDYTACIKQAKKHAKEFFELKLEELVPNRKQVRRKHQWPAARPKVGRLGKCDRRKGETLKSTSDVDDNSGPPEGDETKIDPDADDDLPGLVDISKSSSPDENSFFSGLKKGFLLSGEKGAAAADAFAATLDPERRARWNATLDGKLERAGAKAAKLLSGRRFHPVHGDLDSREM